MITETFSFPAGNRDLQAYYVRPEEPGPFPGVLEDAKHLIQSEVERRRAEHVVYECDRVLKSIDALTAGDLKAFGHLMTASHISLRDLYEVTGSNLDVMVEESLKIEGCIGSRMTGAGFGGCTVSIVAADAAERFIREVGKNYSDRTGYTAAFYISSACDGGREIKEH
jgi:galactokinase